MSGLPSCRLVFWDNILAVPTLASFIVRHARRLRCDVEPETGLNQ